MPDFAAAFASLKPVLSHYADRLSIKADTDIEYTLVTRKPSPYPQHKGQPMYFGSVRLGKAYVSFHLMPLYMCPPLNDRIPPELKKRMQGKTCFNFKAPPDSATVEDLVRLTEAGLLQWTKKDWA